MVTIQDLHKKFGKNKVLKGVDLHIDQGGIFAVLGPNGSGKTTLIKSVLGMVIPNKGTIEVLGNNIKKSSDYRHQIDYLPQIANFPSNLKVKELIKMIKDLRKDTNEDKRLIELFKLEPFLDKKLGNLSGGTKQKVNLVLTFMFDSPLIILDEPTTGLDPISLIRLKDLIQVEKAKGKLLAPKTTTGPNGTSIFLKSGLGAGVLSGIPVSMVASTHDPSSSNAANARNCPIVLPRSPFALPSGSPDSAQ